MVVLVITVVVVQLKQFKVLGFVLIFYKKKKTFKKNVKKIKKMMYTTRIKIEILMYKINELNFFFSFPFYSTVHTCISHLYYIKNLLTSILFYTFKIHFFLSPFFNRLSFPSRHANNLKQHKNPTPANFFAPSYSTTHSATPSSQTLLSHFLHVDHLCKKCNQT